MSISKKTSEQSNICYVYRFKEIIDLKKLSVVSNIFKVKKKHFKEK